ncbi:MAG: acyl-CoA dehydrogenase family protein [Mycobacterium sp.]
MRAARDSYEIALSYARRRHQFSRTLASFQVSQQKLVNLEERA